ncbi:MAG: hypothetical protein R3C18_11050 [Planctomycetaceae bacterium]
MDSYAPCPCGSGKKVKFCCQAILPELSKIERLQENNQPRMAIQLIDKLLQDHPHHGWLVTQRAMALFNEQRFEDARDSLVPFLHEQPDHPLANVLLATAVSQLEPYPASKKVIHRAFLKSTSTEPTLVGLLAGRIAAYHLEEENFMAARQHMAIVLRLGSEQERQQTLMAMLEIDADASIPYPFRGVQPMPKYTPIESAMGTYRKAMKLAALGCYEEAATALEKVVELDAEVPESWHTLALLRAWDGNGAGAAEAFHKAAKLYGDADTAVDVETLAQLLERELPEKSVATRMKGYTVEALSRLLTRLDNDDRLSRVPVDQEEQESRVAARYDILDRSQPTEEDLEKLCLETAPRIIGRIGLFDQRDDETPARAIITGIEGERLNEACKTFEAAAGDLAKYSEEIMKRNDSDEIDDIVVRHPKDEIALSDAVFVPQDTPANVRRKLRIDLLDQAVNKNWMELPLDALGGKTPQEAAGNDELKVPLAAAIVVLDTFLDGRDLMLDINAVREKLGVPQPTSMNIEAGTDLNAYTTSQLQRVNLSDLTDDMFRRVMQRTLVTKNCRQGYAVLREFLEKRPELVKVEEDEASQAYATLADICSSSLRADEALEWVEKGYHYAKENSAPFQSLLFWKMRELSFRATNADDPQLKDLLLDLWNNYGSKIPQVRQRLTEIVTLLKIDPPWDGAILTASTGGSGEVILSAETESTVSGEKKLWIPD